MKKFMSLVLLFGLAVLITAAGNSAAGRGGGGGGGGGGRGGGGGGGGFGGGGGGGGLGGGGGGGGLGGGGGSFGGGSMGRSAGDHSSSFDRTPSFNSPNAGGNAYRSNLNLDNRGPSTGTMDFNRTNISTGNRNATGQFQNNLQGGNIGERGNINNLEKFGQNKSGIENRANFDNRYNLGNRGIVAGNQIDVNRTANFNRPNYGNWYHGDWHGNWDHNWHGRPAAWWTAGFVAGWGWGAATTPWSWGYWPYYNPYCTAPIVIQGGTIDYSQPIAMAQPTYSVSDPVAQTTASDQAMEMLNTARDSFMQGDYKTALSQVDQAILKMPNDTVLHEFRGLVLFALQQYKESAGAVYAVLSVGPGWDWTTLSSLYPNVDVYTEQLRALEQFSKSNPKSAEAHFLLAYQYLTCGYTDAAAKQFKEVVSLNPKDQLSSQLYASLSAPAAAETPKPSVPPAPPQPVSAASINGNWKTTRSDGGTIALNLGVDGKYTWKYNQKDKPQEFSGDYSVADNLLILKQGTNPVMVGQVTMLPDGRFNFKLAGDNPNDPGLTFSK